MPEAKVSVVLTVRNETRNLGRLLDSLVGQKHLWEVVIVDAMSTDGTPDLAQTYLGRLPRLQIIQQACSRGAGRNIGIERATGDLVAFIDGDCAASPQWLAELVAAWGGDPNVVVAGHTELSGKPSFTKLNRVELPHKGQDTTWPSCNLAYPRHLLNRLGGFDERFVTAEDIDLNYRAVNAGARIVVAPSATVHAQTRSSLTGFLRQAFWNGYGRKQLTLKHGSLWHEYRLGDLVRVKGGPPGVLRMGAGAWGYLWAKAMNANGLPPQPQKPRPVAPNVVREAPPNMEPSPPAATPESLVPPTSRQE